MDEHSLSDCSSILSLLSQLQEAFQVDALRSLDRETQCSVPNQLCQRTQASADTESSSIVQRLVESKVVEEHSRARIDIWMRVLYKVGS